MNERAITAAMIFGDTRCMESLEYNIEMGNHTVLVCSPLFISIDTYPSRLNEAFDASQSFC